MNVSDSIAPSRTVQARHVSIVKCTPVDASWPPVPLHHQPVQGRLQEQNLGLDLQVCTKLPGGYSCSQQVPKSRHAPFVSPPGSFCQGRDLPFEIPSLHQDAAGIGLCPDMLASHFDQQLQGGRWRQVRSQSCSDSLLQSASPPFGNGQVNSFFAGKVEIERSP